MLINAFFSHYPSVVFENFLMFVFHPEHLSISLLSSPHPLSCHSPWSWQDPEIPSHLPVPGRQCLLHSGLCPKRGSSSPKDIPWSGYCGSKSSPYSLGCDAEVGQKQDESSRKHGKAYMGSSSQCFHWHPCGVIPYNQRKGDNQANSA